MALSPSTSRRLRWATPAVTVAALVAAGPVATTLTANADQALPPRTAAQLLTDVQQSKLDAFSGTVVETSDLGLPELPSMGGHGGGGASFSSLLSGSHTLRVWSAGQDKLRLALLGHLEESDLVRNGNDVWAWSSATNTATHWTVPSGDHGTPTDHPSGTAGGAAMTPAQAATAALKAIDPSTRVTTDSTAQVAGRSAYQLVLTPRDARSLVGSVRIAVDGATHVPTRVQVYAKGASTPAFQVGFTSFSTSTPPDSAFGFTPPPGATVKQGQAPSGFSKGRAHSGTGRSEAPQVVGSGWTSVIVARTGSASGGTGQQPSQQPDQLSGQLSTVLRSLPRVSGSWGSGHLLAGPLFSAVLTDDGRVAVGAVPPSMLYRALSR